eukprot:6246959-Prymnesium_polylepis.1
MSTRTPAASSGGTVYCWLAIQSEENCWLTRMLHDDHDDDEPVTPSAARVDAWSSHAVGAEKS